MTAHHTNPSHATEVCVVSARVCQTALPLHLTTDGWTKFTWLFHGSSVTWCGHLRGLTKWKGTLLRAQVVLELKKINH